jgi:hypothetical protein
MVFSISATGVALTLPMPLELGTEVEIDPKDLPAAQSLRGRIVHTSRLESVWLLGCELVGRLSNDQLAAWLTTATSGQ